MGRSNMMESWMNLTWWRQLFWGSTIWIDDASVRYCGVLTSKTWAGWATLKLASTGKHVFFFKAKNTYSRCWTHFGTRRTKTQVLDPLKFVWFEWWRNQRPLSTLEFFGKMESYPLVIYDKKLLTMAIVIFPINSMVIFQFVMWTFTRPGMDSNKNDMFKNRSTKRSHCEIRFQPHIGSHTFP